MSQYISLFLPIITLAAGALLQHYLSKSSRRSEETTLRQQQAYVDYLSASVGAKYENTKDSKAERAKLIDAKLRIAVYGSNRVIASLARLEREGAWLNNEQAIRNYLKLVEAMRETADVKMGSKSENDLEIVLFGQTP